MMARLELIVLFCSVLYIDNVNSYASPEASSREKTDLESTFRSQYRRRGRLFGGRGEFGFPDVPIFNENGVTTLLHLMETLDDKRNKRKEYQHSKHVTTDPANRSESSLKGSTSKPLKEEKDQIPLTKEHLSTGYQNKNDVNQIKDEQPFKDYTYERPLGLKQHLKRKLEDQRTFKEALKEDNNKKTSVTGRNQNLKKGLNSRDDINLDVWKSGSKHPDKTAPNQDQPKVDFVTSPFETETHTLPKNGSWKVLHKKIKRNDLFDITRASRLWLGVGVGASCCLVVVIVMTVIYLLLRSRRGRSCKLNELSLDTSNDDRPIYIKLSQLHRPKRSPNYIVTVLDDSHFSINSDDTSEEELFDISAINQMSPSKAAIKNNLSSKHNVTSTPKKNNCTS